VETRLREAQIRGSEIVIIIQVVNEAKRLEIQKNLREMDVNSRG